MRDILKPALVLLAICVVVATMLAGVYQVTKPIIAQRASDDLAAAKLAVLPQADSFRDAPSPTIPVAKPGELRLIGVSIGSKGGSTVGVVCTSLSQGYDAAGVNVTVGVDTTGKITGVRIGDQNETPGLGSRVFAPGFLAQFHDLSPKEPLQLVKNKGAGAAPEQIDAVSGATFTSRAVTRAVEAAVEAARAALSAGGQS